MNAVTTHHSTFAGSLARATPIVKAAAVVLGSLFIAASAQIVVPFFPVPMTMQTFAIMTVGLLFGARFGALTVAAYLLEGLAGLPVFNAGGSVLTLIANPSTAGYLVGFLFAAAATGFVAERTGGRLAGTLLAALVGDVVLFVFGVAFLAALIGFPKAVTFGLLPFLPGEALKVAFAVTLTLGAGRLVRR